MTATTEVPLVRVQQLTQAEYRADPRLATHSRCKLLLPPSTPAHAKWELEHPSTTDALDFGRAAHREVLGAGDDYVVVTGSGKNPNAWVTNATKAEVEAVRASGATPITPAQHAQIRGMAEALRRDPLASALLREGYGRPEQAILWPDEQIPTVQRGCMVDWLPDRVEGRRLIVSDYKSAVEAHPAEWARAAPRYGYASQAAWIADGLHALYPDISDEALAVLFIVQSKTPPYPPAVVELQPDDLRVGRGLNRYALQLWHRCWETGQWPGYSPDPTNPMVHQVSLPQWWHDMWSPIS